MSLIRIRNLTKLYRMGDSVVRALDGVDLDIAAGEFVAITGASGSGKSTMMHLLGCLDRPSSGAYVLNGRNVSQMTDRELAEVRNRDIGFVFQTFNLINRTSAVENVGVPLFYARKLNTGGPARMALERVGLGHRYGHKPNELSGGERQRVAIARAIVNNPVLVLADEPTGNLDSRTGDQIMEIFHGLNAAGVTIILVTHEPDIARQARRVVQMRDGRIVSDGPPTDPAVRAQGVGDTATVTPRAAAPVVAPAAVDVSLDVRARDETEADSAPLTLPAARTVVWQGGISLTLTLAATIGGLAMAQAYGLKAEMDTKKLPPTPVIVMGFCVLGAYVLGIVLGLIAVIRGYFAVRAIRSSPVRQLGTGRALAGIALGVLGVACPFVSSFIKSMFFSAT